MMYRRSGLLYMYMYTVLLVHLCVCVCVCVYVCRWIWDGSEEGLYQVDQLPSWEGEVALQVCSQYLLILVLNL